LRVWCPGVLRAERRPARKCAGNGNWHKSLQHVW
jgi:hypothetical protein